MDPESRRSAIRAMVEESGVVRLTELSEALGVAQVTIHRDLDLLASAGEIERVRGGARVPSGRRHEVRTDFRLRRDQAVAEKAAIARRALDEIPDGATIFLDSSTTSLQLALALEHAERSGLTLVTNSPAIAYRVHAPYIQIIVTPGDVNQSLRAITGSWTIEFLASLNVSLSFVSAAGLDRKMGLMTTQRDLAEVTRAVLRRSERVVALIDSSKFDSPALIAAAPLSEISLVITDSGLDSAVAAEYEKSGVAVAIAPMDPS